MFYEYAVDPKLIDDISAFDFLCEAFGKDKGRLLADYPKNRWFSNAHHQIKSLALKDRQHKECVEYLKLLKRQARLKDPGRRWNDKETWLNNANQQQDNAPFKAILTTPEHRDENDQLCRGPLLHTDERWSIPNSQRTPRTAEAIADALLPLLSLAKKALIVEPYFNPTEKRFTDVLGEICQRLSAQRSGTSLTIITGADHNLERNVKQLISDCETLLPRALPEHFKLTVELKHQAAVRGLHDRFLLTDIGGIELGAGFDCREDGSILQLTRLSETDLISLTEQVRGMPSLDSTNILGN